MGRNILFFKKEPKNFCLFGVAPSDANDDSGHPAQAQKFFGSFFQKRTLLAVCAAQSADAAVATGGVNRVISFFA
jgi:hypothetical protein